MGFNKDDLLNQVQEKVSKAVEDNADEVISGAVKMAKEKVEKIQAGEDTSVPDNVEKVVKKIADQVPDIDTDDVAKKISSGLSDILKKEKK